MIHRRSRLWWYALPGVLLVPGVVWGVTTAWLGDGSWLYPLCLSAVASVVTLDRETARQHFKRGWLVGHVEGVNLFGELHRERVPVAMLRLAATGDPSPEPWDAPPEPVPPPWATPTEEAGQ